MPIRNIVRGQPIFLVRENKVIEGQIIDFLTEITWIVSIMGSTEQIKVTYGSDLVFFTKQKAEKLQLVEEQFVNQYIGKKCYVIENAEFDILEGVIESVISQDKKVWLVLTQRASKIKVIHEKNAFLNRQEAESRSIELKTRLEEKRLRERTVLLQYKEVQNESKKVNLSDFKCDSCGAPIGGAFGGMCRCN